MSILENIKMKKWVLYRHTSPSGKVYIGITSNMPERRWQHGNGYKNCVVFYKAILKYGWDNIKHEILFTDLSEERAKRLEIDLISHYKRLNISYNVTNGGDGALGRIVSEETRAKQRAAKIGKPLSDEHIAKIRANAEKRRGIPISEETKRKIRKANKGKKPSPQTFTALIKYIKTHPMSEETKKKIVESNRKNGFKAQKEALRRNREQIGIKHRKPVVQLSLDGSYITSYECGKFASTATGIKATMITACCKGKQFRAGGFLWMYECDYKKHIEEGTLKAVLDYIVFKANKPSGSYVRTEEWRKKRSEKLKGVEKRSEATKQLMIQRTIEAKRKPVAQMTCNGTIIAVYPSGSYIKRTLGFSGSFIGTCCNGKRKSAYGYKWKYITKEEYEKFKTTLAA